MTKRKNRVRHFRRTAADKVARIRQILYPGGDMDHEWDVGYLDDIARVILDYDGRTGWTSWPPRRKRPRQAEVPRA